MKVQIRVPATSANLGPGFDSLGIAITLYLTVTVLEENSNWIVEHDMGKGIPHNETNMIIKTALRLCPSLPAHRIKVESDIPLARGLGSSSSAIVAGIELAVQLGKVSLTKTEKVQQAAELEGHPDNVAPAILGDFVVSSFVDGKNISIKGYFPETRLVAYIPEQELLTTESRNVLPKQLPFMEATHAGSIGNTLVAALMTNQLEQAGQLMEADLYHERYRQKLVPHLAQLRKIGHLHHAVATYLSGAGPTVMTIISEQKLDAFTDAVKQTGLSGKLVNLEVDRQGVTVKK
ncbi:homoserine kinase [Liquorilactobacillus capillatus]|uniref:Homoserine kinase n=1 Tax=Liquorilactobacillus capillatus DSM 19910 TaxID=1423731 RepID=A0A0R1M2D6_9LACO|nr:homoserine kinase [Liquorilactobacillus capillatus]KRL02144.1 homoserine kinase [Liquorilactobacillus capillatus DSM 19910]